MSHVESLPKHHVVKYVNHNVTFGERFSSSLRDPLTNQAWVAPQYPVETIHGLSALTWGQPISYKVVGEIGSC